MNSIHSSSAIQKNGLGYYAGWAAYITVSLVLLWGIVSLARLLQFPLNIVITFSLCLGLGYLSAYVYLPVWYKTTLPGVFVFTSPLATNFVSFFIVALVFTSLYVFGHFLGDKDRERISF